jgi:hypothetical protein
MKKKGNIQRVALLLLILISFLANILLGVFLYKDRSSPAMDTVPSIEAYLSPDAEKYAGDIRLIKQYIEDQQIASPTKKIDFVRNWVNTNSVHNNDPSYNLRAAFNTPRVLARLWKTHEAKDAPVNLTCGPRAFAMQKILDHLRISSRVVMIFTDNFDSCLSHTFLEVFNPETANWEVQDPDYNISYVNKKTGHRIATFSLIFGDIDAFIPVSKNGEGWKVNKVEKLKENYFETIMYGNPLTAVNPVILINTDKFNLRKTFKDNGGVTFREFANKYYRKPIFIENRSTL